MELFLKTVNGFYLLTIFAKSSIWIFDRPPHTSVYDASLKSKFLFLFLSLESPLAGPLIYFQMRRLTIGETILII